LLTVRHFLLSRALFPDKHFISFQQFPNGELVALFSCVGDQEKENDS